MRTSARRPGHRSGTRREAIIAGYVLKVARESIAATQADLADAIKVEKDTVQGWESGRRPLTATNTASFVALGRHLAALGVASTLSDGLMAAVEADLILDHALGADGENEPFAHPLSAWVLPRSVSEMLAWPFTGVPPLAFQQRPGHRRRGPVPTRPVLSTAERQRFFDHFRTMAEKSLRDNLGTETRLALLRRQAYYHVSWDSSPEARDWLSTMYRSEQNRLYGLDRWSPDWVTIRSLSVARACQGDPEPLSRFIATGLTSDDCKAANLNYWAYWAGEIPETQQTDDFMASPGRTWAGIRLLRRLTGNLVSLNPYVELNIHSVLTLLQSHKALRHLLEDDLALASALTARLEDLDSRCTIAEHTYRQQLQDIRRYLPVYLPPSAGYQELESGEE